MQSPNRKTVILLGVTALIAVAMGVIMTTYNQKKISKTELETASTPSSDANNIDVNVSSIAGDLGLYTGLAPDIETNSVATSFTAWLISPNHQQIIVTASTLYIADGPSDFGGYPTTDHKDYICTLRTKICSETTILREAEQTAEKIYGIPTNDYAGWIFAWDPESQTLSGSPHGEGVWPLPEYLIVYHYDTGKIEKISTK